MKKIAIVIPARYQSTRLPGKPLKKILGREMILRVWDITDKISKEMPEVQAFVATDDQRIMDFCQENGITCLMTSDQCKTGTDRVVEAAEMIEKDYFIPEFIINLQGDNPLCPPWFISSLIDEYKTKKDFDVSTTVIRLSWEALDQLRENKKETPFSGTCAVVNRENDALYFSKNIIPAIRKEDRHRAADSFSPVLRHSGLYGYTNDALKQIKSFSDGIYEPYEGLEQLRFLENGMKVRCVEVNYREYKELDSISGVDSQEDVERAEAVLEKYKEIK